MSLVSVPVILNASAGTSAADHETLQQRLTGMFQAHGMQPHIVVAENGEDLQALAQCAVQTGSKVIAAGGGDGTLSTVASVLTGTDVALGVLPLGTLNHFAKDLRLPLDLEDAVQTIATGQVVHVDVGDVNGRVFLNNASLGLYPRIVRHRQKQQERLGRGKWPALLWATLLFLYRYPFLTVRIRLEDVEMVQQTPFVFIGNNTYQFDMFNVGARVCLDAGHLSLYCAPQVRRLGLLSLALRGLLGQLRRGKDFEALCVSEVVIETRRPRLLVATDGEVNVMETPLHYRSRPGALRLIVPAS